MVISCIVCGAFALVKAVKGNSLDLTEFSPGKAALYHLVYRASIGVLPGVLISRNKVSREVLEIRKAATTVSPEQLLARRVVALSITQKCLVPDKWGY